MINLESRAQDYEYDCDAYSFGLVLLIARAGLCRTYTCKIQKKQPPGGSAAIIRFYVAPPPTHWRVRRELVCVVRQSGV